MTVTSNIFTRGFLPSTPTSPKYTQPGDCNTPWLSTAPTANTRTGSMREELSVCTEDSLGVSGLSDFFDSRF